MTTTYIFCGLDHILYLCVIATTGSIVGFNGVFIWGSIGFFNGAKNGNISVAATVMYQNTVVYS